MNNEVKWVISKKVNKLIENLQKNNLRAYYFDTPDEAVNFVISSVLPGETIAYGGSNTVKEIGLLNKLDKNQFNILDRYRKGITKEEKWEIERQSLLSDVFITGTNAITLKGQLVNIDHSGNRVSAILFGPKRVFIVIGINKIFDSLDMAISRVQYLAAPINAKRAENEYTPPCVETGECIDCASKERICNSLVIVHRQCKADRITVIIIGKELGY